MKNATKFTFRLSAISIGVIASFAVTPVMADDEEIKALTQPKSSVQVEMIGVDQNSAKFGEYNGLSGHNSGAYPNGALNLRGGSAYTGNEKGDTSRWSVTGDNLGLTSRSANASVSDQGSWSFGVNFDQLQHNTSDSYQTPYQGNMGGSTFTLPAAYYQVTGGGSSAAPFNNPLQRPSSGFTSTTPYGTQALTAAQAAPFGNMIISNTRYNTTLSGSAIIDSNSSITFEYNNLKQTGAKLGGASSASAQTGIGSQGVSILPMPTNSQTDTVNLAYNWKDVNSHFTASYFGSFYQNNVTGVQWAPYLSPNGATTAIPNTLQTMSAQPSNSLNQINLAGGYDFSKQTKLTGNASVSQNLQNQGFSGTYDSYMMYNSATPPVPSMNGLVNTAHADVKLTDQSIKDLLITGAAKFDERDNLTQSNMYNFNSISGTSGAGNIPNTPMSIKQTQLLLGGDYRLTKDQKVGLTLANNAINRWCNQYGTTSVAGAQFLNTASCVAATASNENKADLAYKIRAAEDVSLKLGAGYANRKTAWNNQALVAMPGTAYVNNANVPGYMPFFEASRKQFVGKASADWQPTEDLGFTLGGKYTNDTYPDSTYGVQNGFSWSLNLDGTYAYSQEGTVTAYATQQSMQRSMVSSTSTSATAAPPASSNWSNNLNTNTTTIGVGFKQGGLIDGKFSVNGDATYSKANSIYSTNAANSACNVATTASCGILPGIQNNLAVIKLGGNYQLDKNQKFSLMYWYQHLYSNDFYYNGLQSGYTPYNVLPTNQTSPSYSVNVISAAYTYTFD